MDPSLCDIFQRSFLSCRRLNSLPWTELDTALTSDSSLVLDILEKTVLHPLCRKYPPSRPYRRLFLSELIKKHERVGTEPLDELYEALAEVLNAEETETCHKTYLLPSGDGVTLSENRAIISEGTTGLVTWEAALSLAEWAIENPHVFKNRTILELGSGIGLTGLAICKSCHPKRYVFSDYHQRVLQQLKENIHLNGYLVDGEHGHQVTEKETEIEEDPTGRLETETVDNQETRQGTKNEDNRTIREGTEAEDDQTIRQGTETKEDNQTTREGTETKENQIMTQGTETEDNQTIRQGTETEEDNQTIRQGTDNSAEPQLSVIELNWDTVTEEELADLQADVVIASDVVYDPEIIIPFSRVLKKLFSCVRNGRNLEMFIASTIRNPETYRLFQTSLDGAGLRWRVLPAHTKTLFSYDSGCTVEILKISSSDQHLQNIT
ncbi:protein-lysine N-methyltransferase EEF2KMT isoform 1-T2 [Discoglossus pictus]